ncbi:MAG: PHP domain-containing protein [Ectothiorhodospiraceae bacterium]|nr:PHP domain-containing protein [Ectothiorhodospiraceae bacterium]
MQPAVTRLDIDLHCHSTVSDGTLPPAAVVERAAAQGVRVLALTDHDTLASAGSALEAGAAAGVAVVPGVEISTLWQGRELHVVGLRVDPADTALLRALEQNRGRRRARAGRMADKLIRSGVTEAREVLEQAGDAVPTRTHFARFLHDRGYVNDVQQAFDRYLKRGKRAWVGVDWMSMEQAVGRIRAAGGQAVLAHPLAYGMTGAWMRRVLTAFREAGGAAVEVCCGNTGPQRIQTAVGYALRYGLMGSVGSDFHGPENPWIELGRLRPLPATVAPIWRDWPADLQPLC